MPRFLYTALATGGGKQSGTIDAATTLAAGHLLKEQGLLPIELKEEQSRSSLLGLLRNFGTVPLKEKIVFIEDFAIMLKSGIAGPRALAILAHQTKNKKFKKILSDLAAGVESGKSLHEAMGAYPSIFSNIFISMIKVGEMSGNLEKSLDYLSNQLEREADLKSKTKGAMIYPAVIVSAMVLIGLLMAIFVLPKLTSIFKEFNTQLPLATRIVIAISDFMAAHSVTVIVGLIVFVGGLFYFLRTPAGKRGFDWFLLHMPVINPIVKKINLARFSRILGSMLKSGIAIVEGLKVSGDALGNIYYREVASETANNVRIGKPLTEAFSQNEKLFPYIVTQMLEVGEETGTIENILEQLAAHYETEVDDTMRNLSSIIEPLLLLVIGGVVGLLALALIGPIYNISQTIQ